MLILGFDNDGQDLNAFVCGRGEMNLGWTVVFNLEILDCLQIFM